MYHVFTMADIIDHYADWNAPEMALQIMALEAMGAEGVIYGAPTYQVIPWFGDAP